MWCSESCGTTVFRVYKNNNDSTIYPASLSTFSPYQEVISHVYWPKTHRSNATVEHITNGMILPYLLIIWVETCVLSNTQLQWNMCTWTLNLSKKNKRTHNRNIQLSRNSSNAWKDPRNSSIPLLHYCTFKLA